METTNEFATALSRAQAEMNNPAFDSQNPHFRSKFASLAAVRNAVIPAFSKHGVFVSQQLTRTDKGVACTVILMHAGGTLRYEPFEIPISKDDAQGVASASTYARRYTLQAIACVVGDDDDDGNAASGKKNGHAAEPEGPSEVAVKLAASRFLQAHRVGYSGPIYDVHLDLIQHEELYKEAWKLIPAPVRREIKEHIEHEKQARATHAEMEDA